MRKEVYVKFAEALDVQKSARHHDEIYTKLAEAVQRNRLTKQAAGVKLKPLPKTRFGRVARNLVHHPLTMMSPKVEMGKHNPLRLFTNVHRNPTTAVNTRVERPSTSRGSSAHNEEGGAYAYHAGGGKIDAPLPTYDELAIPGKIRETRRLSPLKILAALGLTAGAGGAAAKALGKEQPVVTPTPPAPATSPENKETTSGGINKWLLASILGGGLLGGGALAAHAMSSDDDEEEEKRHRRGR